nr:hypothetical protein [Treponema sp.]
MKSEVLSQIATMPTDKIFETYMNLISKCEGEEVYRMTEPVGEGIMKHNHIAEGIELVYSELESYSPNYQAEKQIIDGMEIMYILDGHAEFELQNRKYISCEKGDVVIFNNKTAVRKSILGKSGMNCLSIIVFTDAAINYLNNFFKTQDFNKEIFFKEIRNADTSVSFPCDELLEKLFMEMIKLPDPLSKYQLKLAAIQVILTLMKRCRNLEKRERLERWNTAD